MSARRCQKQGRALIALNRKSVEYIRLLVMAGRNALRFFGRHLHQRLFGFRFGVRLTRLGRDLSVRPRLGLSREYGLRCHVGCGCWRDGKSFCRIIIIPGCWQTGALAGDYHRRIALLERRIRNEQQRHQHRTYHCKKGENWHWRREPSLNSRRKQDGDRSMASKCTKGNAAKCPWFPELQFHF
jgi:hypothetical protein